MSCVDAAEHYSYLVSCFASLQVSGCEDGLRPVCGASPVLKHRVLIKHLSSTLAGPTRRGPAHRIDIMAVGRYAKLVQVGTQVQKHRCEAGASTSPSTRDIKSTWFRSEAQDLRRPQLNTPSHLAISSVFLPCYRQGRVLPNAARRCKSRIQAVQSAAD